MRQAYQNAMYYLSSKPLSNQSALMINSYLVIKKNNVLLHYKNEFDIQPIKVITPSFPLWRGQGEVKKNPIKAITTSFPLWRGQGEVKKKPIKTITTPFPLWRGQGEVKRETNKIIAPSFPFWRGQGEVKKETTNAKHYTLQSKTQRVCSIFTQ